MRKKREIYIRLCDIENINNFDNLYVSTGVQCNIELKKETPLIAIWKIDICNNILIIDEKRMDMGNDLNVLLLPKSFFTRFMRDYITHMLHDWYMLYDWHVCVYA